MKILRLLLAFACLFISLSAQAQPGKKLAPTTDKSLVVFTLKDFDRKVIAKAPIAVEAANGNLRYAGRTDKEGTWQCLLPINATYWVNVGDSMHVGQVTIPNKPFTMTKHTTYFNGVIEGRVIGTVRPSFNMMPPADGQAVVNFEFKGLAGQPLVGELVNLKADGSGKNFSATTDAEGKTQVRVPIGENYTIAVPYNANFDHLSFPAHGGSYSATVKYVYAGREAIEAMRAARAASQAQYDIYRQITLMEQRKLRTAQGHKKDFTKIPVKAAEPPFVVEKTDVGFELKTDGSSPMMTPCYVDGMIVSGTGWDNDALAAVDAATGEAKWAVTLEENGISNVEAGEGVVVCATESCTIYAIAASSGQLLWSKWLADYVLSAPCIADGRVYIGYEDEDGAELAQDKGKPYAMACFDLKTGEVVWQQWIAGEVMSSAVAAGEFLYFNTFSGDSYVLDRTTGAVVATARRFATSAPTFANGRLYMSQRDSERATVMERIVALDPKTLAITATTPWSAAPHLDAQAVHKSKFASNAANLSLNTGGSLAQIATSGGVGPQELVGLDSPYAIQRHEGARPLALGNQVVVAMGPTLRCLDAKSLQQVWEWQFPSRLDGDGGADMGAPIAVNGRIAVACMDGVIRLFDPATGRIVTNYATGGLHRQQPLAVKGRFYAPSLDGKLSVVETGDKSVDGWECWGGNARRTNVGK